MDVIAGMSTVEFSALGLQAAPGDRTGLGILLTSSSKMNEYASTQGNTFRVVILETPSLGTSVFYYLKNTDPTRSLILDMVRAVCPAATAVERIVVRLGDTGAPAGGVAIPLTNVNTGSTNAALATSQGAAAITGLVAGSAVDRIYLSSGTPVTASEPLVLAPGGVLTLSTVTGGTALEVILEAFYR